jgi:hypothetical protein
MAWYEADARAISRTAAFLRRLRALKPGECINLPMQEFQDMELPIPLDQRWTWEEKAEWFRSRAPFYCTKRENLENGDWIFKRVTT